MTYRTLVRAGMRLTGLYLLVVEIPTLAYALARYALELVTHHEEASWWSSLLLYLGYSLAKLGVGLYLLLAGKWVLTLLTDGSKATCRTCGAGLDSSVASGKCPECDTVLPAPAPAAQA